MPLSRRLVVAAVLAATTTLTPARADVRAGVEAWQAGNYPRAVAEWKPLAEQGDADAQFNLGQAYKLGRGVPADLTIAQRWYEKAAKQNHEEAQANLGLILFQNGQQQAGMVWIRKAADNGDPRARYVLATALFNGDMVEKDWPRAYALMNRAATQGLTAASSSLTQMENVLSETDRQQGMSLARDMARSDAQRDAATQIAAADSRPAPPKVFGPPLEISSAPAAPEEAPDPRPAPRGPVLAAEATAIPTSLPEPVAAETPVEATVAPAAEGAMPTWRTGRAPKPPKRPRSAPAPEPVAVPEEVAAVPAPQPAEAAQPAPVAPIEVASTDAQTPARRKSRAPKAPKPAPVPDPVPTAPERQAEVATVSEPPPVVLPLEAAPPPVEAPVGTAAAEIPAPTWRSGRAPKPPKAAKSRRADRQKPAPAAQVATAESPVLQPAEPAPPETFAAAVAPSPAPEPTQVPPSDATTPTSEPVAVAAVAIELMPPPAPLAPLEAAPELAEAVPSVPPVEAAQTPVESVASAPAEAAPPPGAESAAEAAEPVQLAAAETAPKPAAPAKPVRSRKPAPLTAAGGKWRVQLGAYDTMDLARGRWAVLSRKAGLFSDLQPSYEQAGPLTRLRVNSLADRSAAQKVCAAAKAAGQACLAIAP